MEEIKMGEKIIDSETSNYTSDIYEKEKNI